MPRKVVVVGGGFAGLYAAYAAAYNGAEVSLYEKKKIGENHNCGELFTEIYTSAPEECKVNKIRYFDIILNGELTKIDFGELSPFVMTDKSIHDKVMKKKCEELGVVIYEENDLILEKYCFLIDASGVKGKSNYLGNMGKAVCYTVKGKIINDDTAFFHIRNDLKGYSWNFPKGSTSNIGEGVYDYKYPAELLKPYPENIIYKGGGLLPMPTMSEFYNNVRTSYYYMYNSIKVGNAGGLVNPLLGGGEHLAVVSGLLAGCLVAQEKEREYPKALMEIIGDEMRFGISAYEFMLKQDMESVEKILASDLSKMINNELINKTVRKAMGKWITLPIVNNEDLTNFIER